ncbi:MAG: YIP1 family protein [Halocynthiibacter sp.]
MSITARMKTAYLAPRRSVRQLLQDGVGDQQILGFVMIACLLFFTAKVPELSKTAHLNSEGPAFSTLVLGAFMGAMFFAPLFFYALAGVQRLVAKVVGGKGTWFSARLSLFWSLLLISPFVLFRGLLVAFNSNQAQATTINSIIFWVFLALWGAAIWECEKEGGTV